MNRDAWRIWTLAADEDGPVLSSPFTPRELRQQHTFPSPRVEATCGVPGLFGRTHRAPGARCMCGLYAMPSLDELARVYPAEVVTGVRLHGRILPAPHFPVNFEGEIRAAGATITGPGYITPTLASHAPALEARYGFSFTPDLDLALSIPDRLEKQASEYMAVLAESWGWGK